MTNPIAKAATFDPDRSLDLAIVALGYEDRSIDLVRAHGLRGELSCAIGFEANQVLSFHDNRRLLKEHGYDVAVVTDEDFATAAEEALDRALRARDNDEMVIAVDVSSFSRVRLAQLFEIFQTHQTSANLSVTWLYSLAAYTDPPDHMPPNRHVGPVTPFFAGWTEDPETSVTTIMGLGYEPERALGALEQIQGGRSWLCLPISPIEEYEIAVRRVNQLLLSSAGPGQLLTYPVLDPFHVFVTLESLANRCLRSGGGMIFPFGPKIFTAVALGVGCVHRDVAVWRVSPGDLQPPAQRYPSGFVTAFEMRFGPGHPLGFAGDSFT